MGVILDNVVASLPPLVASAPRKRSVFLVGAPCALSVLLPPSLAESFCPQRCWYPYLPICYQAGRCLRPARHSAARWV